MIDWILTLQNESGTFKIKYKVSGRSDPIWHIFIKIGCVWFLTGDLEEGSTQIRETNKFIPCEVHFPNLGKI